MAGLTRILLTLRRHEYCLEIAVPAVFDRQPIHVEDLPENGFAPIRSRVQQRHRADQLVVDDVAQRPMTADPWARVLGAWCGIARRRQWGRREDVLGAVARRPVNRRQLTS